MKKVILTGSALLAFVGAAWAQNSATLNQSGTYQTAVQQQSGNNQVSTINQNQGAGVNTGNWAGTFQTGTVVNTATINQRTCSQGNRAAVGMVGGSGNVGTINQNGGRWASAGGRPLHQVRASIRPWGMATSGASCSWVTPTQGWSSTRTI